jgi:hypothetical protein
MSLPSIVWSVLLVLYLTFFGWYTSFAGPLSSDEIEHYVSRMREGGRSEARIAEIRSFLEGDTGDDFVMVNVIEMRDVPSQVEGVEPGETSQQVLDKYMEYMLPALLRRACHPVLFGQAAATSLDVWGIEGAERWTTAGMMRYRSRRDMLEIASNPQFGGRHEFKLAAMHKTLAFPIDPWVQLGDPRLMLGLTSLVVGLLVHGFEGHRRATRRRRGA